MPKRGNSFSSEHRKRQSRTKVFKKSGITMITENFLDFCHPGLYEIYCRITESSYFGHSENVMYRLGRHYNDLQTKKNHESDLLQIDWNLYGRHAFEFRILEKGAEWQNKQKRLLKEEEYFLSCKHRLYNRFPIEPTTSRKQCTIDGITYKSKAEAARKLGLSPSTMYRLLKKYPKQEIKILDFSVQVSIKGRKFSSITEAINSLKIPKSTLYRRLRSSKYPDWFYVNKTKTRSNDYPEGE